MTHTTALASSCSCSLLGAGRRRPRGGTVTGNVVAVEDGKPVGRRRRLRLPRAGSHASLRARCPGAALTSADPPEGHAFVPHVAGRADRRRRVVSQRRQGRAQRVLADGPPAFDLGALSHRREGQRLTASRTPTSSTSSATSTRDVGEGEGGRQRAYIAPQRQGRNVHVQTSPPAPTRSSRGRPAAPRWISRRRSTVTDGQSATAKELHLQIAPIETAHHARRQAVLPEATRAASAPDRGSQQGLPARQSLPSWAAPHTARLP